jgi:GNAT superfamily N-acetyltransferase
MTFTVRKATTDDADAACDVLRRSIRELCFIDHQNDERALSAWLENKTSENIRNWLTSSLNHGVVAVREGHVCGFAMIAKSGTVTLCYVVPEVQHLGVGRKMLQDLEAQALRWGLRSLNLESTLTAKPFYERNGYTAANEPVSVIGTQLAYPMEKKLRI